MYKVHVDLDGAKNLYFYVQKDNGRYVQLQPGKSPIEVRHEDGEVIYKVQEQGRSPENILRQQLYRK